MSKLTKFSELLRSKKELMFCIFVTLILQLGVSIAVMKWDQHHHILGDSSSFIQIFGIFIVLIGLMYVMVRPGLPFYMRELLFGLFSIIAGLLLSQTIYYINDPQVVEAAATATFINFITLVRGAIKV